jgi:hypothetical protein
MTRSTVKLTDGAACFMLISCVAYCAAMKMEVIYPSETSVDFHQTNRRYITEDWTVQENKVSGSESATILNWGEGASLS